MTRTTSWLAILACAIGFSGCVSATRPLGLPVWSEMQGTWQVEDVFYEVQLLPDGALSMAWIDWDQREKRFALGRREVVVTVDEGATYWNFVEHGDPPEYFFVRVLFFEHSDAGGDPYVALFAPNGSHFDKAVNEGVLSGEGVGDHLLLDDSRLADFVDPKRFAEQFDVDKPLLARRIIKTPAPHGKDTVLHQGQQAHMECLPATHKPAEAHLRYTLAVLKADLEVQLKQPVDMPDPAGEQWARFLNVDPERWAKVMALMPPSELRFSTDENGIVVHAKLSAADFSSYLTCLDSRGFGLVNVPDAKHAHGDPEYKHPRFWVAKGGFGLFEFTVHME
jgi:hypothetical protein